MIFSTRRAMASVSAIAILSAAAPAFAADADADKAPNVDTVVVTARLRAEDAQTVPAGLSVVGAPMLEVTRSDNIGQITQFVPSVNYASPNPRNTALTIRGQGSGVLAIAQSNDGLEPGVGFYVDQVYHARPATAAFDFLDVERVEVLRGPQGSLFGKNTTAGAISVITKAPSFTPGFEAEASGGNYQYVQGKATVTGPLLGDAVAGRLSLFTTQRGGVIRNIHGGKDNTLDTWGVHGQLLFQLTPDLSLRLSVDDTYIDSLCCTQVYVRVGTSLKTAARQYPALAAGQNYAPPSLNPFDRVTDIDADLAVDTDDGGVSGIGEWNLGSATLTSVSAWRWWNWDAANDRDYTGLPIQLLQHIPSRQDQYSQELRIASNGRQTLEYVAGLYYFTQTITGEPITGYGPMATYWLLGPAPQFPANLLDGYTTDGHTRFSIRSYAVFGEATYRLTDRFNITTGLRYTWEDKDGRFASTVSGGAPATGSLLNSKLSILRPQAYSASDQDGSLSGRAVFAYDLTDTAMTYVSYANATKSGGINMSGLPLDAANNPALSTAVIKPEHNTTYEAGVKSRLFDRRLTLNLSAFDTTITDFQTNVVDNAPGTLRGYLANIEEVRIKGVELEAAFTVDAHWSGHAAASWSEGKYAAYKNGPCPLELIGNATTVCDLSGKGLSNLPKWAVSAGGEYRHDVAVAGQTGEAYVHAEYVYRTKVSGDPTGSRYTVIDSYDVVNASLGFRSAANWEASLWSRNLFDADYIQNLTVQAGNSGLIVGTPGDPRTVGVMVRVRY